MDVPQLNRFSILQRLTIPVSAGLIALYSLVATPAAVAQQSLGIAAVVNDEMISIYDLQSRITAVAAFAGFPKTPETQRRIGPQVLRSLIDERLKLQEAKRYKIASSLGDLKKERATLERNSGLKPGQLKPFMEQHGVSLSAIDDQLEAKIVWGAMVNARYARTISVSEEEIEEKLTATKNNKGKPEELVSEIFLAVDNPGKLQEVTNLAHRLIQQIKNGAKFAAVANNFSQNPSSANGGDLGWNLRGQLGTELSQIISRMQPGRLAGPVQTQDGLYILHLRDRRASRGLDGPPAGPEKITLYQLHLALAEAASPEQVRQKISEAQQLTLGVNGCNNLDAIAKKSGSPLSGKLGTFQITQISPQMQALVKSVPKGGISQPHRASDGVIVLMVCDRIVPKQVKLSLKEQKQSVRREILNKRLTLAAERYIRDLRRASFIEVRL